MEQTILTVTNLSKAYTLPQEKKLWACKNVSFQLRRGSTLGIVGQSGSGKSTLAKLLMLLEAPTSGEILYHGQSVLDLDKKQLQEFRGKVQMVFQNPQAALNPKMKIGKIVTEPLINFKRLAPKDWREQAIELLALVELGPEFVDRVPSSLSGGQAQRVNIARALALNPEIIICDEATSALDVLVQKNIVDLLQRLQKKMGTTIIFISHDLGLVSELADDILVLHSGELVEVLSEIHPLWQSEKAYTKELVASIFSLPEIIHSLKSGTG